MSLYLSCLTLQRGHRRTESELSYPYELHRTLCKAWDDPEAARILFRPDETDRVVRVIVQSQALPDWSRLETSDDYLLRREGPKEVEFDGLKVDQLLAFRLRCRPSMRIGERGHEDEGKRKSLKSKEDILAWLDRKALEGGFQVEEVAFDRVYWHESRGGKDAKPLGAVQFDGILVVNDPDQLREAVRNGVGPQKAYGFGLLSLSPLTR